MQQDLDRILEISPSSNDAPAGDARVHLQRAPYQFPQLSVAAVSDALRRSLPQHFEVRLTKHRKFPAITVSDGMWRGALLVMSDSDPIKLNRILYVVPSFLAKLLLFAGICLGLSIFLTLIVSIIVGEFSHAVSFGGVLGILVLNWVQGIMSKNLQASPWATALERAIAVTGSELSESET